MKIYKYFITNFNSSLVYLSIVFLLFFETFELEHFLPLHTIWSVFVGLKCGSCLELGQNKSTIMQHAWCLWLVDPLNINLKLNSPEAFLAKKYFIPLLSPLRLFQWLYQWWHWLSYHLIDGTLSATLYNLGQLHQELRIVLSSFGSLHSCLVS